MKFRTPEKLCRNGDCCAETIADPGTLILLGGTGNLSRSRLIPGLWKLFVHGLLPEEFRIVCCGRQRMEGEELHNFIGESIPPSAPEKPVFLSRFSYLNGDCGDADFHRRLRLHLETLEQKDGTPGVRSVYLALPPEFAVDVAELLCLQGVLPPELRGRRRIALEKPFGSDLESARKLQKALRRHYCEKEIFRADHYLNKDTVQNMLMLRFANRSFAGVWNRRHIASVEIRVDEKSAVGSRAGYYDHSGALRDMVQNHLLELLAVFAMEAPEGTGAHSFDLARRRVLDDLRKIRPRDVRHLWKRGQYASYRSTPGVAENSRTETLVSARVYIDNHRWHGVPFTLHTGKMLNRDRAEITVTFKSPSRRIFPDSGTEKLTLRLSPHPGIALHLRAKAPGPRFCMTGRTMELEFEPESPAPDSYARLLLELLSGDNGAFSSWGFSLRAWKFLAPVQQAWERNADPPEIYPDNSPGDD